VHVLRDDDTGPLSNGGKRRKHASLVAGILSAGYSDAVVMGGRNSFNAAALVPLLAEHGITPWLVRHRPRSEAIPTLMDAVCSAVVPANRTVMLDEWDGGAAPWDPGFGGPDVKASEPTTLGADGRAGAAATTSQGRAASGLAARLQGEPGRSAIIVPEGACCSLAVPGAATLGADIASSLATLPQVSTVVMDAGTGLTAAAAIAGLRVALGQRPCRIVVVDMTGAAATWLGALGELCQRGIAEACGGADASPGSAVCVSVERPASGRSFGSVNASVRAELIRAAEMAGVITEPVYGAKLLHTCRHSVLPSVHDGEVLVVLSGGAHGLGGWAEWLARGTDNQC